jgi:nitronate monooxygenase
LWCWLLDAAPAFLDVCIEERVPSVTLSFGPMGTHAKRAREAGMLVIRQVQTVGGARDALRAGVDVIIAQGSEAGGHTGSVATMALVPQVVDLAGDIPVLAAGGIADGRGLVAALALGAQGVVMGTRFVTALEAGSSDRHRARILEASADDTVFTDVFDIVEGAQWPDGISGRTIRSSFTDQWHGREDQLRAARDVIRAESNPLAEHGAFAGQASGLVREVKPAAEIVADVMEDAAAVLSRLHNSVVLR